MRNSKGFTLIELITVIGIIGILAVIVVSNLGNARAKSRDAKRKTDARAIQTALESYYSDFNVYPANATWQTDLTNSNYIPAIPEDPTNSGIYVYSSSYTQACTPSPCSASQGYEFVVNLENPDDPDGFTTGGQRKYKLCGGANGTASNCAR